MNREPSALGPTRLLDADSARLAHYRHSPARQRLSIYSRLLRALPPGAHSVLVAPPGTLPEALLRAFSGRHGRLLRLASVAQMERELAWADDTAPATPTYDASAICVGGQDEDCEYWPSMLAGMPHLPARPRVRRLRRLDSLLDEAAALHYLHVDAEHQAEEVLAGASATLARHRPLITCLLKGAAPAQRTMLAQRLRQADYDVLDTLLRPAERAALQPHSALLAPDLIAIPRGVEAWRPLAAGLEEACYLEAQAGDTAPDIDALLAEQLALEPIGDYIARCDRRRRRELDSTSWLRDRRLLPPVVRASELIGHGMHEADSRGEQEQRWTCSSRVGLYVPFRLPGTYDIKLRVSNQAGSDYLRRTRLLVDGLALHTEPKTSGSGGALIAALELTGGEFSDVLYVELLTPAPVQVPGHGARRLALCLQAFERNLRLAAS